MSTNGALFAKEEEQVVQWVLKMQCIGLSMSLQQVRFLRYNINNTRKSNMIHKWCALEKLVEMVQSKTPSMESLKVVQRPKVITIKGLNVENVANFYENRNNFTSFITTTHPTSKIVTSQKHTLDKVVKEGSFKKKVHVLCTYYFQRENGCLCMCVSMLMDKHSQLYIFKGKRLSKNYI
jgi:hypothetical protein